MRNLNFRKPSFSLQQFSNCFLTFSQCSLQSPGRERCSGEQEKMSVWLCSLLVFSSLLVLLTFTLSMSRSYLRKNLILPIFSDKVTSRNPNKNLLPHICWYCQNRFYRRSFRNLDVNIKSYPCPVKSSKNDARQRIALTSAEKICAVNVNFKELGILSVCHTWTHSAFPR